MYNKTKEEKEKQEVVWGLCAVALVTVVLFPLSIIGFMVVLSITLGMKVMKCNFKQRCIFLAFLLIMAICYLLFGLELGFSKYFSNYLWSLKNVVSWSDPVAVWHSIYHSLFTSDDKAIFLNLGIGALIGCIAGIYKTMQLR